MYKKWANIFHPHQFFCIRRLKTDSLREALKQALKESNIVIKKAQKIKKVYCGPFPAGNCVEIEASIKKLSKSKMNEKQRARTIRCLSRHLRIMKCREK